MPTVSADELTAFATALLQAGGFSAEEAAGTADLLVWANLRGVESHGVLRIPRYVEMIETGAIRSGQKPTLVREFGATCVVDYGRAPGAVAMTDAAARAGDLARTFGIGWCSARAISHAGAIGYFTQRLALRGMVGIAMTASKPLMTYHGAKGEVLSTNPLSIAVPRADGEDPILLDMSTAAVALGKVMAAKDAGKPIPKGWGVDADGGDTEDPAAVKAILPMAGAKGSGLSLMIEILASVLVGNAVIAPVLEGKKKGGFNGLVLALQPSAFGEGPAFADDVEQLARSIHGQEPAPGFDAVRLPGERGAETERKRKHGGIPIAAGTAKAMTELADKLGVSKPAAFA